MNVIIHMTQRRTQIPVRHLETELFAKVVNGINLKNIVVNIVIITFLAITA